MGLILDSSVLIAAERGRLDMDRIIQGREEEPFGLSMITIAELLHGVQRADSDKRRLQRSAYVEKVIELFPIFPFEVAAARVYADLWARLSGKGIKVGAHDLIIAATAMSMGFSVATLDRRHFEKIEGLDLEIWRAGG